jgi:tripartite-type tricarboxylate transporter receptor subunit TctC
MLVKADTPYKTVKDVVDAAKASAGSMKAASTALQDPAHLGILQFAKW